MPTQTRRPRLRFSLRTMFVAVTLIAIFIGYHVHWLRQRRSFASRDDVRTNAVHNGPAVERPWAPGVLWLFGELGKETVAVKTDAESWELISDKDRKLGREARRLFPEAAVWLLYDKGGDASRNWAAPLEWVDLKPDSAQK